MDIITQGLLGAITGQAVSRKGMGPRAAFWGAVGGIIPDLDTVIGHFGDAMSGLIYHRGFTHSLWFAFVCAPLLAWVIGWFSPTYRAKPMFWNLVLILFVALFTHPLLDCCTSYGTQLFAPFDRTRFAINAVAIVDLFYTITLLLGLLMALKLFRSPDHHKGLWVSRLTLVITTAYLGWGYGINQHTLAYVHDNPPFHDHAIMGVHSDATLGQIFLRRIIAQDPQRVCIGYKKAYQSGKIHWRCASKGQDPALKALRDSPKGQIMAWFSRGQYFLWVKEEQGHKKAYMDDIRYLPQYLPGHGLWGIEADVLEDGSLGHIQRREGERSPDIMKRVNELFRYFQVIFQTGK